MGLPKSLTTRRLVIVCVVSLLGATFTFLNTWMRLDLGYCDYREKPGCGLAVAYADATLILLILALAAGFVVVARGIGALRAWSRERRALQR